MAAHVVVLDARARRALIKVTPMKHMSDILGDACAKFNINPAQYGLKHQKKIVDLSLSFRLSGLSSGARLELVQLSKSPTVVSIALQLPESESQGLPSGRLTDIFPSNTTLWLVLRKFESGVAGSSRRFNLTARGAPQTQTGDSGQGRLFYETPVLNILGKELSSFTELQKTLGQLGLDNGNALIRLSFRVTDRPLEEAMTDIDAYFKELDADGDVSKTSETPSSVDKLMEAETPASSSDTLTEDTQTPAQSKVEDDTEMTSCPESAISHVPEHPERREQDTEGQPNSAPEQVTVSSRSVTVFAPPSNSTPQSAQTPYNEADYLPTTEHAQTHQKRLLTASRPNRLAGDAELATQEAAVQEKLLKVREIEVKIRFPDQSQAVSKFTKEDTAEALYVFAKSCLDTPLVDEKFSLFFFPTLTAGARPSSNVQVKIPECKDKALIRDLKMNGRVLVNFVWEDNAALSIRGAGGSVLRPELRQAAAKLQVKDTTADEKELQESSTSSSQTVKPSSSGQGKKKGGIRKWMKLPGKK